jgi:hypothetical protein
MSNTTVGLLTIAAILAGPIVALELQRLIDRRRESRNRKLSLFKTLMSYRATTLSPTFVQALNLIDVEFDGDNRKEKAIRDAWKVLLDHFSDMPVQNARERSISLTTNLLLEMGRCLGYDFDEVHVKKGAYYPKHLVDVENEQHTLRRELLELLDGKRKVPIAVFEDKFPDLMPQGDENTLSPAERKRTSLR